MHFGQAEVCKSCDITVKMLHVSPPFYTDEEECGNTTKSVKVQEVTTSSKLMCEHEVKHKLFQHFSSSLTSVGQFPDFIM